MAGISYVPDLSSNASVKEIEDEISFLEFLMSELVPSSGTYDTDMSHYEQMRSELAARVESASHATPAMSPAAPYDGTSDGPSPANSSASSFGFNSNLPSPADPAQGLARKRTYAQRGNEFPESKRPSLNPSPVPSPAISDSFDFDSYLSPWPQQQNQMSMPLRPLQPSTYNSRGPYSNSPYSSQPPRSMAQNHFRPMAQSNNFMDLTMNNGHTQYNADPFAELQQAYQGQPMGSTPDNAFNMDYMSQADLAQFLTAPGPILPGFNHLPNPGFLQPNYQVQPPRPAFAFPAPVLDPFDSYHESDDLGQDDLLPVPGGPEAIAKLIENIKPDEEIPRALRQPTPRAMRSQLMEHQKLGLKWLMKTEESNNKGGILADEMGLGKTIQALALILARPSTDGACKTTLIIAPVALMRQWEKEIQRHVHDSHRLSVYVYHGTGKKADFNKLRQFDVVLTTFGTLAYELKQKDTRKEAQFVQREMEDPTFRRASKDKLALIGPECMWYRIIIDEAQCIKNKNTQVSKASAVLQARYRLCMTGTPMMNSVDELYPIIRFLRIKPYNDYMKFNIEIGKQVKKDGTRDKAMKRLQALLKSIMLRRQKNTIIDGEEICKIPPKHVHQTSVQFQPAETEIYKAIETKSQVQFNKYLKRGTVSNNYAYILVLLLRLRQACCHPHLIKDLAVQVSTEGIGEEELLARAEALAPDAVKRLLDVENFECPICLDGAPNPTIFQNCGHTCCGECFQKLIDPTSGIQDGHEVNNAKCPHCREPLHGDKITDYRHFCKVHCPEKGKEIFGEDEEESQGGSDGDDGTESEAEEEDGDDVNDKGDLKGFVVSDDESEGFEPPAYAASSSMTKKSKKGKGKKPRRGKKAPRKTLAQLKKESTRNKDSKRRYLKRLRDDYVSSSKIDKTMELVNSIHEGDPTEKILIFSQFTSLLDLVEIPLQDRGFGYQRYDGSMKMDDRAEAVNQFMDEADQKIMLVSLKAGNAGLNLNKASQVIILDPFWNPYVEEQAIDRAHRMPQQREVHVHRVLVPETVEDRIIALQEKKRELIGAALDERAGRSISRLGVSELMYLFGMGNQPS